MRYTTSGKQVFVETPRWPLAHVADASDEQTVERIVEALNLLAEIEDHRRNALRTIPDTEILTRAREAAIAESGWKPGEIDRCRRGVFDGEFPLQSAIRALRDLAKPLSEIVPAVDADLVEARRIVAGMFANSATAAATLRGKNDDSETVKLTLVAIRRSRELERNDILTSEGLKRLGIGVSQL